MALSAVYSTANDASTTISVSGQVQSGDLIVLFDRSVGSPPGNSRPTGFTEITNITDGTRRGIVSYKISDGTETTLTGMGGSTQNTKTIVVFRGDSAIASVAIGGQVDSGVTGSNPTAIVINSDSGAVPMIVMGFYGSGSAVSPRTFSPAEDGEVSGTLSNNYLKYKFYTSSPADVTVDMDDEGNGNMIIGFYIELTYGGTAYSLVCAVGAFVLTGVAAATTQARKITAALGTFTLSGVAAATKAALKITAALGTFTFSGVAAALNKGARLACDVGAFVLSGVAALFPVTLTIVLAAGSFAFTGVAAALSAGRRVAADVGAFTFTGIAAALNAGKSLACAVGAFTFTGVAAALSAGRRLAAGVGAFTFTGIAAILLIPGLSLLAEAGAFVLSAGVNPLLTWVPAAAHSVVGRVKETLVTVRQQAPRLFKARIR